MYFSFEVFNTYNAVILVGFVFLTIFKGIRMIPQGYMWTVERFGRYTRTLTPGLRFLIPFIDSVGAKQNMMEQVLDVQPQEVISSDNAMVTTDAVCFFQIMDPVKASYEVNDLPRALQNLIMTNIRAVLGSMELDQMLSNRDKINVDLLDKIDEATNPWGLKITRVEIKDITPPRDLVESMANQMKAERDKRAQILNAEGEKQAAIEVAEGEKRAQILKAEGEKEAAFRLAEAREREAEAEAKATHMVSQAISQGDPQALNYFIAQKYTETLGKIASSENEKLVLMPLEASNVIGSLAGMSELLNSVKK